MLILAFFGGKSYFAQEISRIFEGSRERNQQKEICPLVARNSGLGQAHCSSGSSPGHALLHLLMYRLQLREGLRSKPERLASRSARSGLDQSKKPLKASFFLSLTVA
jgi:hypothetical protein